MAILTTILGIIGFFTLWIIFTGAIGHLLKTSLFVSLVISFVILLFIGIFV